MLVLRGEGGRRERTPHAPALVAVMLCLQKHPKYKIQIIEDETKKSSGYVRFEIIENIQTDEFWIEFSSGKSWKKQE